MRKEGRHLELKANKSGYITSNKYQYSRVEDVMLVATLRGKLSIKEFPG